MIVYWESKDRKFYDDRWLRGLDRLISGEDRILQQDRKDLMSDPGISPGIQPNDRLLQGYLLIPPKYPVLDVLYAYKQHEVIQYEP